MSGENISEARILKLYDFSLILKGLFACLELISGFLAYFIYGQTLLEILGWLTHKELIEDPQDAVANFLLHSAQGISLSTQHFLATYLVVHGLIKIILVILLLEKKVKYYPAAMIVFGLFVSYQIYRFDITHASWLLIAAFFDIIIIGLTWHEYRYLNSRIKES